MWGIELSDMWKRILIRAGVMGGVAFFAVLQAAGAVKFESALGGALLGGLVGFFGSMQDDVKKLKVPAGQKPGMMHAAKGWLRHL